jgi:hypothetical protein
MNVAPRQGYFLGGIGDAIKGIGKGIKSAAKGIVSTIKDNPALALAAFNFAPMLAGKAPFIGMGSLAGSAATIPGLSLKGLAGEKTLGKTLGVMAGGTVLGGVLGALSPEEQEEVSSGRNISALRSKLTTAYQNLGYDESEIPALVENDVSEYTKDMARGMANGGRIGYSDGTPELEYGTKEYFKKNLDNMNLDELIEKPNLLMPLTIGMIEERLQEYADSGGDITPYVKKYNIIKQKNAEYFQGLSEEDKKNYIQRNEDQLREDVEMGIFPGQDKLGIKSLEKETDSGIKIPAPEKDIFDIEGFKKYRMDAATGGRINYAMGTDQIVNQASGIMGLPQRTNKAGVKELDLRESGGFIPPVGVKEKADDIPAMLSNNEFVFTADAVRGMGDGNVNKGAQRMYDMMKKLEKGGRV